LYLTKFTGLCLQKHDHQEAEIIVDASYPGEQARGTTGVIVRLGNQTIHGYTRRQQVASLSNSESEYIAGAKDASWIRQLLEEMEIRSTIEPIILLTDNNAAQKLSQDTTYRRRTRHIDNWYHYIRDQVGEGYLIVPGKTNPADPLTKFISAPCLKEWMKKIGVLEWIGARSI
jgi:ribonuclease HI